MYRYVLALVLLACPLAAAAGQSDITVENVWSRAAMAGHTGVVYLTVTNTGTPDALTGVNTQVARTAELHQSYVENGIMKMRPAPALPVAPDHPVTLAPGGYHIMLMDLKQPLVKGETFPLTLTFDHAPPVTVDVRIEAAGARLPTSSDASGREMNMSMPMK